MNPDIDSIRTEMVVVGSDGRIVGAVESVLACELKLARTPDAASAHAVPLGYIARVDDVVRLAVTEAEARRRWRETS